jgi:hypothetical protein
LITTDDSRASSGLTGGGRVKWAGASVRTGIGPEIYDQIESHEKKISALHAAIKMLTAKFEAEVKGIEDRITKKKIEVNTELSLQRKQQLEDQALQAQHAQET